MKRFETILTPPQSLDRFTFDLQRFDADTWDGTVAASFSTTGENSITITSAEELALLAQNVNDGNDYSGWTITLGVDLDLSGHDWTPIGNISYMFNGTFDGGNHTISNIFINSGASYKGLFGAVGSSGTVKNVTLIDVNVTGTDYVGGVVGCNEGTVSGCEVSGSVTATDDVAYVGGVVGSNQGGTVSSNTFSGTVSGTGEDACVGAIVGANYDDGTVSDNTYTGNLNFIGNGGGDEPDYPEYPTATGHFVTTADGMQYVDNYSDKVLFELRGATGLTADYNVQGNEVDLFAENFDGDEISVVSNDGGYAFVLVGDDLSGKTFVANGNTVAVAGEGLTVDVTNGDSIIELGDTYGFNVTGFGAGDVIKLSDFIAQEYRVSILGIESDGDGGATINLIGYDEEEEVEKTFTITVGGLNVGEGTIGWTTDDSGISTYGGNITATGAIVAGGQIVYAAEVGTMNLFQLKGVDSDTLEFYGNEVDLFVDSFTGNEISVVSNGGGYTFDLSNYNGDDYSGKTFVANGNNVMVWGYGLTVDVSNGDSIIELGDTYGFNVTGFGAGDVIKLSDFIAQEYRVSILGIESDGDGSVTISIGDDDGERYTISVGGLNISGADTWTFDAETNTAKIVAEAGVEFFNGQIVGKAGTQFEVSGVTSHNDFEIFAYEDWKSVDLKADTFTSNVKVESNDGGYDITLRGKLNGIDSATFTATEYNDNISNEISGVLIDGGAGDDYICNRGDVTASVKGGAGADTFNYGGGEMTITDYVDGTDKIFTDSSITISNEVEVSGNDVVFTTSYPGYLPGDTYSGKIVVKGAANLSELKIYDYDDNATTYKIPVTNEFNAAGTGVIVKGTKGDFHANSALYSITASQENSTLIANAKNNTVIIAGGGENILTGGTGNDSFKFSAGGGIVTDYGIGATKDGSGKAVTANGVDIVKVDGKVNGIYFEREGNTKNKATFTAVVTYTDGDGDNELIVLKDIVKKPTKTGTSPIYQTNDVAAATLKIWDTSGSKQAVLSAAKLKKLFHDDGDLSVEQQAQVTQLSALVEPANIVTTTGEESTFTNPLSTPLALNSNKPKN